MKYGIGALVLILGGLITWYVLSNNPGPEISDGPEATKSEKTAPMAVESSSTTPSDQGETGHPGDPTSPGKVEEHKNPETGASENVSEENDEEDYGEPVSKEDFKDFITTALDELSEDETTALAIVKEMDKIAHAQPAHEEEVARFYRECSKRPKVSPKVQEACQQAMREKGL